MSDMGFPSRRHPFFAALRQAAPTKPFVLVEDDLDRVLPRHFPLSIPGDFCPGIPIEPANPEVADSRLVDSDG